LFVFLLFRHRRAVPVEVLLDALFRDQAEAAAKNGLRVAATLLRDALEPERVVRGSSKYLSSDGRIMRLDLGPAAWVDWDEFRRQAARTKRHDLACIDRVESAQLGLSLVTEPVLPEFYGDEWFFSELEAIEHETRAVRVRLGFDLVEEREYVAAAEQARLLLAADALDESALEIEVRALCGRGANAEALRRVRGFEKRRLAEFGEDSVSHTVELCRRLAGDG
jgi:DNA-binding SARP family transcriptional activator